MYNVCHFENRIHKCTHRGSGSWREILKKIRVIKARNVVSSVELKVYKTTMATGGDLTLTAGDIEGLSILRDYLK